MDNRVVTPNEWFLEHMTENGYAIAFHSLNPVECFRALTETTIVNRVEMWSQAHAETAKGFAPVAYKQDGKVRISQTFAMLTRIEVTL